MDKLFDILLRKINPISTIDQVNYAKGIVLLWLVTS